MENSTNTIKGMLWFPFILGWCLLLLARELDKFAKEDPDKVWSRTGCLFGTLPTPINVWFWRIIGIVLICWTSYSLLR
jgi:hypothetical protein